jgi:hypothetical protein
MIDRAGINEALERIAVAAMAMTIVIGSGVLWIGLPPLGLWIAGEVTHTNTGFLFAALGGIPLAMVGGGWLLYRLNARYEALRGGGSEPTGRSAWLVSQSEERAGFRRQRAPRALVDVAMTTSAVVAIVLMVIWFFFLAEMKLAPMA